MNVYVVRQKGIYWHDILFITKLKNKAIAEAQRLSRVDVDNHHKFIVCKIATERKLVTTRPDFHDQMYPDNREIVSYSTSKPD